jgi:hypothetical protein
MIAQERTVKGASGHSDRQVSVMALASAEDAPSWASARYGIFIFIL